MPYTRSQRYNNHKNDFCKVIKPYLDKFECSNKQDKIIIMTDMFNLLIQEKWFLNKNSFHSTLKQKLDEFENSKNKLPYLSYYKEHLNYFAQI